MIILFPFLLVNELDMAYAERLGIVPSLLPGGTLGQAVITWNHPESSYVLAEVQVPVQRIS